MIMRLYDKILEEVRDEDGLVVLGHGLGAPFAFANLVDSVLSNSSEGSIVLGLQISPALAAELSRHVIESGKSSSAPRVITSDYSIPERREVYAFGGFLAATARILVHDFLRSVIPVNKVVGIIVNDAHRVHETTAEAFVLRLYRKNNKEGFIKAFTEEPEALRKGFHNCEKIMRSLYVKRLFLWPRFHEVVQDVLDTRPADVVELTQPMTTSMLAIQQSILDATAFCLGELKRANRNVDLTEIKIEEALYRSFHDIIKNQLEGVWHTTGAKVRQPLEDLKFLRKLLSNLHKLDCIQFHELVESLRQGDGFQSTWLMTREADIVFTLARNRVYRSTLRSSNTMEAYLPAEEKENGKENYLQDGDSVVVSPVLELNPKWNLLEDVLKEIESDGKRIENPNPRAIIFVRDEITAIQISQFLCKGGEQMLVDDFERFLKHRSNRLYRNAIQKSMTHTKEDIGDSSGGLQTTLTQFSRAGEEKNRKAYVIVRSQNQEMEKEDERTVTVAGPAGAATRTEDKPDLSSLPISASSERAQTKVEIVLSIVSNIPGNVKRLLDDLQPSFVVIYDPVVHCVRQVEMYKADHPGQQLRVYFVTYEESVEQKRYLYSVQREQEAFEALIREKETMIIHANQEGRLEDEQLE
uniref:DNA repair endonuclease XPF n=1 Tax=Rhodosorus marinus TaxID=101924 RepID=A0A7S3A8B9_9RHOD|mmetsp:Transcript_7055/g.31098  ORF Transcript_7055/g.31098 Transcript_7055/m.31098 type:complete len:640 (+) Transcript_7055:831-2750(+)